MESALTHVPSHLAPRSLSGFTDNAMTNQLCQARCKSLNYVYAGTQWVSRKGGDPLRHLFAPGLVNAVSDLAPSPVLWNCAHSVYAMYVFELTLYFQHSERRQARDGLQHGLWWVHLPSPISEHVCLLRL